MEPNIILIVLDATRFDHLSCYGAARPTSPTIDALAQKGMIFENCFAASVWTPPSHATLFTGKYPSQCGTIGRHQRLDGSHITMAEFLRRQGYRTGGVGSAWISRSRGFDYGFEDFLEQWRGPSLKNFRFSYDRLVQKMHDRLTGSSDGGDYAGLQWTKRWIDQTHRQGKFYAFMRFLSAHIPYAPPPRFKRLFEPELTPQDDLKKLRFLANKGVFAYMTGRIAVNEREWEILRAWYDACIRYIDSLIAGFIEWLDKRRLLESTLIVITADHGENFGDHGLADHQYCIYDTLLHVPLIITGPKELIPTNKRVSSLVSLIDIFPSIASLIGAHDALPPDIAGQSFFLPEDNSGRDAVFAEYGPPYSFNTFKRLDPDFSPDKFDRALKAVRTLSHKYILSSDGNHELYDIHTDAGEQFNIIHQHPELAKQLHHRVLDTLGDFSVSVKETLSVEDEAKLVAHLRDLGYM